MEFMDLWQSVVRYVFEGKISTFYFVVLVVSILTLSLNAVLLIRYLKVRARKKRRERAEFERQLQFCLPERENTFVRARLNTVLQVEKEERAIQEECSKEDLQIEYAKSLLLKVLSAPLSRAERMETEETAKRLQSVFLQEKWSFSDLRFLNESFSSLLKLSAKYAV